MIRKPFTKKSDKELSRRPVVIIFGAGVTGLTAAHELSERGFDVKVVEARRRTFGAHDCIVGGLAASQYWVHRGESSRDRAKDPVAAPMPAAPPNSQPQSPNAVTASSGSDRSTRAFGWTPPSDERYPLGLTDQPSGPPYVIRASALASAQSVKSSKNQSVIAEPEADMAGAILGHDQTAELNVIAGTIVGQVVWRLLNDVTTLAMHVVIRGRAPRSGRAVSTPVDRNRLIKVVGDARDELKTLLERRWLDEGLQLLAEATRRRRLTNCADALLDARKLADVETETGTSHDSIIKNLLNKIEAELDLVQDDPQLLDAIRNLFSNLSMVRHAIHKLASLSITYIIDDVGPGTETAISEQDLELAKAAPSTQSAGGNRQFYIEVAPGEQIYPGEHGYRFFPGFYRNLFDTMRRTPLTDNSGRPTYRTAFDNLISNARVAFDDPSHAMTPLTRRPPRSPQNLRDALAVLREVLHFSANDMARMTLKLLAFTTMCHKRRVADLEDRSWWDYIGGDRLSEIARRHVAAMPHALVAMDVHTDARMHCALFVHNFVDYLSDGRSTDMTLNGPTSDSWLDPWRRYLELSGVEFYWGRLEYLCETTSSVEPVLADQDQLVDTVSKRPVDFFAMASSSRMDAGREPCARDRPTFYLLALDVVNAQHVVNSLAAHPDSAIGRLKRYELNPSNRSPQPGEPLRIIAGVQFYFDERLNLFDGHIFYLESPWSLTSVAQTQYWQSRTAGQRPGYRTIVSVDVGRFDSRGLNGKTAWECTKSEFADEVWRQIDESIDSGTKLPKYKVYHVDEGIRFDRFDRFKFTIAGRRKGELSSEEVITIRFSEDVSVGIDNTYEPPIGNLEVRSLCWNASTWQPWNDIVRDSSRIPSGEIPFEKVLAHSPAPYQPKFNPEEAMLMGAAEDDAGAPSGIVWRGSGIGQTSNVAGKQFFFAIGRSKTSTRPSSRTLRIATFGVAATENRCCEVTPNPRLYEIEVVSASIASVKFIGGLDGAPLPDDRAREAAIELVTRLNSAEQDWLYVPPRDVGAPVETCVVQNENVDVRFDGARTLGVDVAPSNGVLEVACGHVRYRPNRDFVGHDAFVVSDRSSSPIEVVEDVLSRFKWVDTANVDRTDPEYGPWPESLEREIELIRPLIEPALRRLGVTDVGTGLGESRIGFTIVLTTMVARREGYTDAAIETAILKTDVYRRVTDKTPYFLDGGVAEWAGPTVRTDGRPAVERLYRIAAAVELIAYHIAGPARRSVVLVEVLNKYRPKAFSDTLTVSSANGPSAGIPIRLRGRWRGGEADAKGSGGAEVTFAITQQPTRGRLSGAPPNLVYYPSFAPQRGWSDDQQKLTPYERASELHMNKIGSMDTMYQVNPVGDFAKRPGVLPPRDPPPADPHHPNPRNRESHAHNFYKNLVLAGTYMKTYTRLTSMEAANESARHAVNVILEEMRLRRRGERFAEDCEIFDLEKDLMDRASSFQLFDIEAAQALDQILFDRGLPHVFDILRVFDWLENPNSGGRGLEDLTRFIERSVLDPTVIEKLRTLGGLGSGLGGAGDMLGMLRQLIGVATTWLGKK